MLIAWRTAVVIGVFACTCLCGVTHAACSNPVGQVGSLNFSNTDDRFEYCNASDVWVGVGLNGQTTGPVAAAGTSVDFTGLPSNVKRITVMLSGISTNGTSMIGLQLGHSGGYENSGYAAYGGVFSNSNTTRYTASSVLFPFMHAIAAANIMTHTYIATHGGGNTWMVTGTGYSSSGVVTVSSGVKTLSGTLDRLRMTTDGGVNTFDAGTISVTYE